MMLDEKPVLIVEGDRDMGEILEEICKSNGLEVQVANNGQTALALARGKPPGFILLDISLSDMSGWELLERFRQNSALTATRYVVCSGGKRTSIEARANALKVEFLHKPFDFEDLLGLISQGSEPPPNG